MVHCEASETELHIIINGLGSRASVRSTFSRTFSFKMRFVNFNKGQFKPIALIFSKQSFEKVDIL